MADDVLVIKNNLGKEIRILLHDNADGTYSIGTSGTSGGGGAGDASAANQVITNTAIGSLTETAPATDTASSGLNGRLQRIAQRLTSLIAAIPGLGTKTMTGSQAVTLATDDTQIGAKTTASVLSSGGSGIIGWLSDAVTQLKLLATNSPALQNILPKETSNFAITMNAPQKTFRCGFESAVASGLDTAFFTPVIVGAGMAASQSSGSGTLTSGTTAFAESIYRSVTSYAASLTLRYSAQLSQRIANQEFYVELVDVIGDALVFTANSTTSITVAIPANPFTAANVGQSVYAGAFSLASCPSGRYIIASVSGNNVTFTVAAFPASGSGTCSLFGWNFQHVLYNSTTPTAANYDAARNGYSSGDTVATINTTAAPGHVGIVAVRDATGGFLDQLSASSTVLEATLRASRVRNIPEDLTNLFIQIRMVNLASAPASTTTLTMGFIEIENFVSQQVSIVSVSPQSLNAALPVQIAAATQLPASLGAKTGALSLSVVPNTDTLFPSVITPSTAAANGISPVVSGASLVNGLVLKASPGNLYSINVFSTAAGFAVLGNSITVAGVTNATALKVWPIAANAAFQMDLNPPIRGSTGLSLAFSSTAFPTITLGATAFVSGEVS